MLDRLWHWLGRFIDRWLHGDPDPPVRIPPPPKNPREWDPDDEDTPVDPDVRPIDFSAADTSPETPRAKKMRKQ